MVFPLWVKLWGLRILIVAAIVLLCWLVDSSVPSLALALVWGPNGLFLWAFMRGSLHLPRVLEPVHPVEPVLYRWLGVGVVKRLVATRTWPLLHGFEPPQKARNRQELLYRTELSARGAEICHAATFALASVVLLIYLAVGNISAAAWILVFNIMLNGYPVMLQRSHRWRVQQLRAQTRPERLSGDGARAAQPSGSA
jgi:hypothetical protein